MKFFNRLLTPWVILSFVGGGVLTPRAVYANEATVLNLPAPGTMIGTSASFIPTIVKGITIYPNDPFKFDFIIDSGNAKLGDAAFKTEATKLIKYFLASLTVPEKEVWVNLSPSDWVKCHQVLIRSPV